MGLVTAADTASAHVHPTQIYDSLIGLFLFIGLFWLSYRKTWDGQVFFVWLMLYPIGRSTVELFRGDDLERGFLFEWHSRGLMRCWVYLLKYPHFCPPLNSSVSHAAPRRVSEESMSSSWIEHDIVHWKRSAAFGDVAQSHGRLQLIKGHFELRVRNEYDRIHMVMRVSLWF